MSILLEMIESLGGNGQKVQCIKSFYNDKSNWIPVDTGDGDEDNKDNINNTAIDDGTALNAIYDLLTFSTHSFFPQIKWGQS